MMMHKIQRMRTFLFATVLARTRTSRSSYAILSFTVEKPTINTIEVPVETSKLYTGRSSYRTTG